MINIEQKVRNILYGLDKYNYCLESELEDAEKAIVDIMREAYHCGMNNIDCDGCTIDTPDDDFQYWLKKEL